MSASAPAGIACLPAEGSLPNIHFLSLPTCHKEWAAPEAIRLTATVIGTGFGYAANSYAPTYSTGYGSSYGYPAYGYGYGTGSSYRAYGGYRYAYHPVVRRHIYAAAVGVRRHWR